MPPKVVAGVSLAPLARVPKLVSSVPSALMRITLKSEPQLAPIVPLPLAPATKILPSACTLRLEPLSWPPISNVALPSVLKLVSSVPLEFNRITLKSMVLIPSATGIMLLPAINILPSACTLTL